MQTLNDHVTPVERVDLGDPATSVLIIDQRAEGIAIKISPISLYAVPARDIVHPDRCFVPASAYFGVRIRADASSILSPASSPTPLAVPVPSRPGPHARIGLGSRRSRGEPSLSSTIPQHRLARPTIPRLHHPSLVRLVVGCIDARN